MVVRVAKRVQASARIDAVHIATDDERIAAAARTHGFEPIMTPVDCASGTDRIAHALASVDTPDLVINVQGDEPLIDPRDLDALVEATFDAGTAMGTLARPYTGDPNDPNCVKVARATDGRALYFSRAAIPHGDATRLLHVGVYAYTPDALARLAAAPPSPLELSERLEQLRALELGMDIHVAMAQSTEPSIAIDTPEDVERVLRVLKRSAKEEHGSA